MCILLTSVKEGRHPIDKFPRIVGTSHKKAKVSFGVGKESVWFLSHALPEEQVHGGREGEKFPWKIGLHDPTHSKTLSCFREEILTEYETEVFIKS